jgi:VIT1/CCC1 family predicted Fe2+/Mn2+ transporter
MIIPLAAVIVSFVAPMLALMILFAALARRLRFNPRGTG